MDFTFLTIVILVDKRQQVLKAYEKHIYIK